MADETLYTWVQLSDVHFGHGSPSWREDQADVVDKLVQDIPEALNLAGAAVPSALFLTGDIAYSGTADQFAYAREMLSRINERLGADVPVFAVAGNHDVVRTPRDNLSTMRLLKELRSGGDIDESLAHKPDAEMLEARFSAFRDFCQDVGSPVCIANEWVSTVDLGSVKLRLVGWNTGLLCNDNSERGALGIPLAAAIRSLRGRDSNEIIVVLTHHGLDWLQEALRNKVRGRLWTRGANVHLSGHEHNPDFSASENARGERLIDITAGAIHADEDRGWAQTEYYYSIASIVANDAGIFLNVYPRKFSLKSYSWVADVESAPAGEMCASFRLISRSDQSPSEQQLPASDVRRPFIERLRKLGRRRTTFPTDLSTAQVVDMELVVPARTQTGIEVIDAIDRLGTDSTLILGDPGSGKTILAYTLAKHWLTNGLLPIAVDLRDVGDVATSIDQLLEDLFQGDAIAGHLTNLRFIVDGLDEALGAGLEPEDVHSRISALQRFAPVVALCRRREYATRLGAWLSEDFDSVIDLAQWGPAQFTEYLERLAGAGQIRDTRLASVVEQDPRLATLITRPLLARMLTLVANSSAENVPTNVPALYNAYLTRLAESADVGLRRITGTQDGVAMGVWRRVAWEMFLRNDRGVDAFTPEQVLDAAMTDDITGDVAFRAVEAIMDVDPGGNTVSFLHYSLFEFLVAQTIAERISELAATDPAAATEALSKDLTHEIRSYLVSLLREADNPTLHRRAENLVAVYKAGRRLECPASLTVCNLVVYVLSRLGISADDALVSLLRDEDEPFLRNSIQWALARQDHRPSVKEYIDELNNDPHAASLNRGYLLYYYGDIDEHAGPPYLDGGDSWGNTREKVTDKFRRSEYETVSASRRLVDVFTFCDMALSRGQHLTSDETALLEEVLEAVPGDPTIDNSLTTVRGKLDDVRP